MNFDLSDEQRLLQETVDKFLANECPPARVRQIFDSDSSFDPDLWKDLAKLGLGGLALPEQYGGAGLELLDLAVVAEILGRRATPGPFFEHALAGMAIALAGSEEQKRDWLPRLAAGDARATVAFAEADDAWQPDQWKLPAAETLAGTKHHVPHARHADLILVGLAGGNLALVERGAPGLTIEAVLGLDRTRRLERVQLDATPCTLLPDGPAAAPRVRDAGLVLIAADAFGGGAQCVEVAVEYAKTREQFGVKIGEFQALKHQLANMALEIEPARGLYWYAAHAFDQVPAESAACAALANSHLTDRFVEVARNTVEAHGGIGYTWECDVHFWLKRAVFDRAFLGDPGLHRRRAADLYGW